MMRLAAAQARLAVGTLWLRSFIAARADRHPERIIQATWRSAQRLGLLFRAAETYRNGWGWNWKEILLAQVLRELGRRGYDLSPEYAVRGLNLLRSNASKGLPAIVVMMHSPVAPVHNRVLSEEGIAFSLLAHRPARIREKARLLGHKGELDTIERTSDALLMTRRKLGEGRMILACVDFLRPRPDSFQVDVMVSPALFELARTLNVALIYADSWVAPDGRIQAAYALPRVDPGAASGAAMAADFIAWLRTVQGDRRDIGVAKWRESDRPAQARRMLPLTIARRDA